MGISKCFCVAALIGTLSGTFGYGQAGPSSALPSADPFTLEVGSSFAASGAGARRNGRSHIQPETITSDVAEAISIIRGQYASPRPVSVASLSGNAISSMLKQLDPHSNYYDPNEFQEILDEHASEYSGTGTSIAGFERNGRLDTYIVSTLAGSPAARAGLQFGDRILTIEGRDAGNMALDQVRGLLRGNSGTTVRMTVERGPKGPVVPVSITRERLHEPAVPAGFLLRDGVGYIDLTSGFNNSTFSEFETAISGLNQLGMRSLVLDLRGNGGGILEQAIKVAEKFLPPGSLIVSQRGRYSAEARTWKAGKQKFESMPLVLLVDHESASATEVLAGAIQDNDRALIVGEKTFGKGLVQSVLNLPQGAGLTLTAARYYTPTGRSIQRDYSETGLYNYYRHRSPASDIDKPLFIAKTVTKRTVLGGDGITPEIKADSQPLTRRQISLLDPIFFFVREELNRASGLVSAGTGRLDMGSKPRNIDELSARFAQFVKNERGWANLSASLTEENEFTLKMMNYYLAIGSSGQDAARQVIIGADPVVREAITILPEAARLYADAERARRSAPNKKAR